MNPPIPDPPGCSGAAALSAPFENTLQNLLDIQRRGVAGSLSPIEAVYKYFQDPLEAELEKWVTQDPEMNAVKDTIRAIKHHSCRKPILITGPTGTGKELLAKALTIHEYNETTGKNVKHPFIAQNCGGFLNKELIPSIFFGYKRGAFTGASEDRKGILEEAGKGIVFLDEIGDLDLGLQAAFLRAIQEAEVYPVGSVKPVTISCQFIAATKYDLRERVKLGLFRDDLFARLRTFELVVTGLISRPADIPLIAAAYGWTNELPDLLLPDIYAENVRAIQCYIERMKVIGYYNMEHKMLLEQEEKIEATI